MKSSSRRPSVFGHSSFLVRKSTKGRHLDTLNRFNYMARWTEPDGTEHTLSISLHGAIVLHNHFEELGWKNLTEKDFSTEIKQVS